MIKAQRFRQVLIERLPVLASNPDKLILIVPKGKVNGTLKGNAGYTLKYDLNVILTDFSGEPDEVFSACIDFMREQQPEIMDNPQLAEEAITFESEPLSNKTYDLMVTLKITEDVIKSKDGEGKDTYIHHPAPTDPDNHAAQLFVFGEPAFKG